MNEELVCPSCDRDYELPKRYLSNPEDIEFLAVPRLLGCLHTCCQSCLEDMWQKQSDKSVVCPQCRHCQQLKSVRHLPMDGSALSHMIPLNGSSSSWCCRCHDEVPSYSWCRTCSAAFCQFHHQDIAHHDIAIDPCMPPISCPEELEEDATLFCHDCCSLVSAQAMLTRHKSHRCSEVSELVDNARVSIEKDIELCREREKGLVNAMKAVRNTMYQLHDEREMSESDLRRIFGELKQHIQNREDSLLQRLNEVAQRKKMVLTSQLDDMSVTLDNTRHCIEIAERLLKSTDGVRGGGPYVLATANPITTRCDYIDECIIRIPFEPQTDPSIAMTFIDSELELIKSVSKSVGAVLTRDNIPSEADHDDMLHTRMPLKETNSLDDVKVTDDKKSPCIASDTLGDVTFTVRTGPAPKLSMDNRMSHAKESVVVEIRAKPKSNDLASENYDMTEQNTDRQWPSFLNDDDVHKRPPPVAPGKSKFALDTSLGSILGQVVFLTEVDKKLMRKYRIRTNFESFVTNDQLPTFRLTREIVGD